MVEPLKAEAGLREVFHPSRGEATQHALRDYTLGILDCIDIALVVVGSNCKLARFNRAAAEALDLSPADVDHPTSEIQALRGVPDLEQKCLQAMTDRVPVRLEMRRDDRWFLVRIAPYPAPGTEADGVVLTFSNITAFRASIEQAIYEREYTKTILNAVLEPLVVLDDNLQILTGNRAFYEWFRTSRDQIHGVALSALGDDEWRASGLWFALKATLAQSNEFQTIELDCDFPAIGPRTVLLDAYPLIRDGRRLVLLTFRDITKRKRTERALVESEEALRKLNRRKDEFLAVLAHELRNPLAPIRQASAISKAATATDEQKRWSHDVIDRQVNQMALLLDDLLDISRVTRGTLELRLQMTDLTSIIAMATETAQPLIEAKGHILNIDVPDGSARFAGDPLRLAQVLSNLLTNAAKYSDPGGQIRLQAICNIKTVMFCVADNGIGIPHEALGDVFAMFSQVKSAQDRSEGGLGIGLALAKGLVELHGGTLEVHSEGLGKGSEFIVKLPRTTLADASQRSATAAPGPSVSRRVLIADDNRDAADSLAMLLRMEGHEVTVVNDGSQALAMVDEFRPELALLDIGMPELNGYEVAQRIRQSPLGSFITLIAVTGWGQASDKAQAATAGFNHHLTKPVELDTIRKILRPAP